MTSVLQLAAVAIFAALSAFAIGWFRSSDDDGSLPKAQDDTP